MWYSDYISEINKQLVTKYKFPRRKDIKNQILPEIGSVKDGNYPMKIGGKIDNVKIINGTINCCDWDKE